MSTNTAGDTLTTCIYCGETYYLINGHNCSKRTVTYFYNPSMTVKFSRRRKIKATITKILFLVISKDNIGYLKTTSQGKNYDGSYRNKKYLMKTKDINHFCVNELILNRMDK